MKDLLWLLWLLTVSLLTPDATACPFAGAAVTLAWVLAHINRKEHAMSNGRLTYAQVRELMKGEPYDMSLVGTAARLVRMAANEGIDSRLEICFVKERGDRYREVPDRFSGTRLKCTVSEASLPVLLRRLLEIPCNKPGDCGDHDGCDVDEAYSLVRDILDTLGYESDNLIEIVSPADFEIADDIEIEESAEIKEIPDDA